MRDLLLLGSCIFDVYTSPCPCRATGGVVTLVRKEPGASFDFSQAQSVVPGRVLRVSLMSDGCELVFHNVHNVGLSPQEHDRVCQQFSHDIDAANVHPLGFTVLVGGDFNFLPRGGTPLARADLPPQVGETWPWPLLRHWYPDFAIFWSASQRYSSVCHHATALPLRLSLVWIASISRHHHGSCFS